MPKPTLAHCFHTSPFILTEGGVGQRIGHEFGLTPDPDIVYAGLIYHRTGRNALASIYRSYLQIAEDYSLPMLLMTNTRRANKERVLQSKYRDKSIMGDYACFLRELVADYHCHAYVGGMMGCKGDAYSGTEGLTVQEAIAFRSWQMGQFDKDSLDFLFAGIMPTLPEAMGMARVMEQAEKPYIISFMINAGGTLLDGHTIHDAIAAIDGRTERPPLCYMTNCVHPAILQQALENPKNRTELVRERFCGIQANAASVAPWELDGSENVHTTTPGELASAFSHLHNAFPLKIYGGCCGTDHRHMEEMAKCILL